MPFRGDMQTTPFSANQLKELHIVCVKSLFVENEEDCYEIEH